VQAPYGYGYGHGGYGQPFPSHYGQPAAFQPSGAARGFQQSYGAFPAYQQQLSSPSYGDYGVGVGGAEVDYTKQQQHLYTSPPAAVAGQVGADGQTLLAQSGVGGAAQPVGGYGDNSSWDTSAISGAGGAGGNKAGGVKSDVPADLSGRGGGAGVGGGIGSYGAGFPLAGVPAQQAPYHAQGFQQMHGGHQSHLGHPQQYNADPSQQQQQRYQPYNTNWTQQ
jgi:hypothetical protein